MALPSPLPDDPRKWDGWNSYLSQDFYERLCTSFESRPSAEQIEDHSRQLLVWWQKKLPLKNQPSNPIAQLLRGGIDSAPRCITEARMELLNPERRAQIDGRLLESRRRTALTEFQKFLDFALADKVLTKEAEATLSKVGRNLGLYGAELAVTIDNGLKIAGARREADLSTAPILHHSGSTGFRRLTRRLTRLVTPRDQSSAEDERSRFPEFHNSLGMEMLPITTGKFLMGSHSPEAPANEQPSSPVTVRRFHLARFPVTNAQYEQFDPGHARWRGADAGDSHPVVYVSHADAVQFCEWLSEREGRRYQLPTEAEWEYAARGTDGRIHPWAKKLKSSLLKFTLTRGAAEGGDTVNQSKVGKFGDTGILFGGHDPTSNEGCVETVPVESYPLSASPFGVENLLGNVWEWCADYYGPYGGGGSPPARGTQRVYRGGSWKSRFTNTRTTTRGYNVPTYASDDVGFRVACECQVGEEARVSEP